MISQYDNLRFGSYYSLQSKNIKRYNSMKKLHFVVIIIVAVMLAACSANSYVQKGDKYLQSGRYFLAQKMYGKAYKKAKEKDFKAEIAYKNAECFNKINKTRKAASWYRRAVMNRDTFASALEKLAYAELKNNRIKKAKEYFQGYIDLNPQAQNADAGKILTRIDYWEEFPGRYKVSAIKHLNSGASDFAAAYMGQDTSVVFFSSTRKLKNKKKKDLVTGDNYSNIFESHYSNEVVRKGKKGKKRKITIDKYQWSRPEGVGDTINSLNNEGTPSFTPDGGTMFFSTSRKVNKNHQGSKIFMVQRNDSIWSRPVMLEIVGDSISVGHPSISADGNTLYFVSDMPGGYGGNDIWFCKKNGSEWGKPQNVGRPVNSADNEMFPYIHSNGSLYFASNRKGGMGGLDIYKAQFGEKGKWVVKNMRYPINSTADDFAITFAGDSKDGMLTSSRRRGNDDIYRFKYVPLQFTMSGMVVDAESNEPIEGAKINLVASNGEQFNFSSDKEGKYYFELKPNTEYIAMITKKGYLNGKHEVNTGTAKVSRNFKGDIGLKAIEKPIELPNIFYDFGQWSLREDSKEALNGLVETLNDNPKITIELGANTDYVGSNETNKELSQKRAQSVVDYLIEKGINWDRLKAHGYGEEQPRKVTANIAKKYPFLKQGDVLTQKLISRLTKEQQEAANQLNRRTEFKVLSTNYVPSANSKKRPQKGNMVTVKGNSKINVEQQGVSIRSISDIKGAFYTIQIGVFNKKKIPPVAKNFKVIFSDNVNKDKNTYTTGIYDNFKKAQVRASKIKKRYGIKAFVTAYKDGRKISLDEAKKWIRK